MRISKLLLAIVFLSASASTLRADGGIQDTWYGKFISGPLSLFGSFWGTDRPLNPAPVPSTAGLDTPPPQPTITLTPAMQKVRDDMLRDPSSYQPNPTPNDKGSTLDHIESWLGIKKPAVESYNSDLFGTDAYSKTQPKSAAGPVTQPTPQKTYVSCADGSSDSCYLDPDGRVVHPSRNTTFTDKPAPDPFNPAPAKPVETKQAGTQPTAPTNPLDVLKTATLVSCGDGSSNACYRTADGKIIRVDESGKTPVIIQDNAKPSIPNNTPKDTIKSASTVVQPIDPKPNTNLKSGVDPKPNSTAQEKQPSAAAKSDIPTAKSDTASAKQPAAARPATTNRWTVAQAKLAPSPTSSANSYNQMPRPTYVAYAGFGPSYRVGGIALTKAAAERMPLNIDIDALALRDNQIVLAGTRSEETRIDAGLFVTALRTACLSSDPYFSLDPVNSAAWSDQGRDALHAVWERVKGNFSEPGSNGLDIQTFSVKYRYPSLWAELAPKYPELKTQLVFRPAWLNQTRFGEILYKADVLLKELSSGVSVVQPDLPFRARAIPGYVPSVQRSVARNLMTQNASKDGGWKGHRLWFDLMAQSDGVSPVAPPPADAREMATDRPDLSALLRQRGFMDQPTPVSFRQPTIASRDGITDLSDVYPKMFVRMHDHAANKDIPGSDVDLDILSGDINANAEKYVSAYAELRDLTDIFRAYVAGVKIAKQSPQLCGNILGTPLTEGEKLHEPLPDFRPSDLFITVAQYGWQSGRRHQWQVSSSTLVSGGISLRGKELVAAAVVDRSTPAITEINRDLADGIPTTTWTGASRRQYVAFNLDAREPPARVPIVASDSK